MSPTFREILCVFAVAFSTAVAVEAAAETYVLPVWAARLTGSDGQWWSQVLLINPHPFAVTYEVIGVFPLATKPCALCEEQPPNVVTIPPKGSTIVDPPATRSGERVIAAAVEIQSSEALNIHSVAYRVSDLPIRQRLAAARGWLGPGVHSVSSVEFATSGVRLNVFIANPSDSTLDVALWMLNRAENEVRASIPARSTRVVGLPMPVCGGAPCSFPGVFPPVPIQIHIESTGTFQASVSSVAKNWAVFSLPDETPAD